MHPPRQIRPAAAAGVSSAKRDPTLPDPTIAESGVPGFEVVGWYGPLTTAGTPAPVVNKLYSDITCILAPPDVNTVHANAGMEAVSSSSLAQFAAYIANESPVGRQ